MGDLPADFPANLSASLPSNLPGNLIRLHEARSRRKPEQELGLEWQDSPTLGGQGYWHVVERSPGPPPVPAIYWLQVLLTETRCTFCDEVMAAPSLVYRSSLLAGDLTGWVCDECATTKLGWRELECTTRQLLEILTILGFPLSTPSPKPIVSNEDAALGWGPVPERPPHDANITRS